MSIQATTVMRSIRYAQGHPCIQDLWEAFVNEGIAAPCMGGFEIVPWVLFVLDIFYSFDHQSAFQTVISSDYNMMTAFDANASLHYCAQKVRLVGIAQGLVATSTYMSETNNQFRAPGLRTRLKSTGRLANQLDPQ